MNTKSLKHIKPFSKVRKKAAFGADGAIMAAATLASAAMTTGATLAAAKQQAKATEDNGKLQGDMIKQQSDANTAAMQDNINANQQMTNETNQIRQDTNLQLQMLTGQQTMNDRMEASKKALKLGGKRNNKRQKLKKVQPSYREANTFKVTDGGVIIPSSIDNKGNVIYTAVGDTHEEYHKTPSGKYKSGIGLELSNGETIEVEDGEKLTDDNTGIKVYSNHDLGGIVPAKAIDQGADPDVVFDYQQIYKKINRLDDDGKKYKHGGCRRKKALGYTPVSSIWKPSDYYKVGLTPPNNYSTSTTNSTTNNPNKFKAFFKDHGGAVMQAGANVIATGLNIGANAIASRWQNKAIRNASQHIIDAANSMTGIDPNIINKDDFTANKAMAVIRSPYININPQLERERRSASYLRNETNRNTLSSAARLQRYNSIADRYNQNASTLEADKLNRTEDINRANAASITDTNKFNVQAEAQGLNAYNNLRTQIAQYNNDIDNQKRSLIGQAKSDMTMGIASNYSSAIANSASNLGNALIASAQGFSNSWDNKLSHERNIEAILFGADTGSRIEYAIAQALKGDKRYAKTMLDGLDSNNPISNAQRRRLETAINA